MTEDQTRKSQLIVLLPECLAGDLNLAKTIHQMARSGERDVFYLALAENEDHYFTVSRMMVTMKAITAGSNFNVNFGMSTTSSWLKMLKELYKPGDQIVCHEEQTAEKGLFTTIPLNIFLHETLNAPIQTLSGYFHPEKIQFKTWLHFLIFWVGFLVILGFFSLLEIQVDQHIQGLTSNLLMLIMVTCEAGILWAWNSLIKR